MNQKKAISDLIQENILDDKELNSLTKAELMIEYKHLAMKYDKSERDKRYLYNFKNKMIRDLEREVKKWERFITIPTYDLQFRAYQYFNKADIPENLGKERADFINLQKQIKKGFVKTYRKYLRKFKKDMKKIVKEDTTIHR